MSWASESLATTGNDVIASMTVQYIEIVLMQEQFSGQSVTIPVSAGSRAEFSTAASAHAQRCRKATTSMLVTQTRSNDGISARRGGAMKRQYPADLPNSTTKVDDKKTKKNDCRQFSQLRRRRTNYKRCPFFFSRNFCTSECLVEISTASKYSEGKLFPPEDTTPR